jgi:hypothetical protein
MIILELFDRKAEIQWGQRTVRGNWRGNFSVGDADYDITFLNVGDYHMVDFSHEEEGFDRVHGLGRQSIAVFSTVLEAIRQFIDEISPDVLLFSGDPDKGLAQIYATMIKRFEPDLGSMGYSVSKDVSGDEVEYRIIKIEE